jgi:hypothetical protein
VIRRFADAFQISAHRLEFFEQYLGLLSRRSGRGLVLLKLNRMLCGEVIEGFGLVGLVRSNGLLLFTPECHL